MRTKLPSKLQETLPPGLQAQWEAFVESHLHQSVDSVRMNPAKMHGQFASAQQVPWCKMGRFLAQRPSFTFDPLFHAGTYYVQEASSMFLEQAMIQTGLTLPGLRVLDLCAAPGGKSTHAASLIHPDSLLLSNEVIGSRVNILAQNLTKWGYSNTWVSNNDPSAFEKLSAGFDAVLVDAPCSGSGLFRKIPEYADEWNTDLVKLCAQRQQRILSDVYPSLKRDGILIYMTCSVSEDENESMLDFLTQQYHLESMRLQLDASWGVVETESRKTQSYGYRFFPHLTGGEGFFLAVLRKTEGDPLYLPAKGKIVKSGFSGIQTYFNEEDHFIVLQNEHVIAVKQCHIGDLDYLASKLKLVRKGLYLGTRVREDLLPSHDLALFHHQQTYPHHIDLSYQQAIAYLKKENFDIPPGLRGWYLVRFEGFNLGWIKALGNRFNNYYPGHYRILSRNLAPEREGDIQ